MNHAVQVNAGQFETVEFEVQVARRTAVIRTINMRCRGGRTIHGAGARASSPTYPEAYMPRDLKVTYINIIHPHGTVWQTATMLFTSVT